MSRLTSKTEYCFLGKMDFKQAFEIQQNLWQAAKLKNQVSIMGLEHPAVVTLGRRAALDSFIGLEIPVVQASRGGLATIHSEGQLVIYPIINLRSFEWGVKRYVENLLSNTQKTFQDFEVKTSIDDEKIGLYTNRGKIAFCGLEIKEGISLHGLSINISNDLELFSKIISCGVESMATDRLKNYRPDINTESFFRLWIENWHQSFVQK